MTPDSRGPESEFQDGIARNRTMAPRKVTVFGGTGFLGQRVVQRLLERDFSVRVAVRRNALQRFSPPFTSTRSKPTSMTIAPLPLPSRVSRAS